MPDAPNYIVFAIPVFFLLIGIEVYVAKRRKAGVYRLNDALTNISCGVGQQVAGVFLKTILAVGYLYLFNNHRLLTLEGGKWWVWAICFAGVDFFYYWFHRYAHEISIMWGGHIVHHQSEEYNLSVALRQGAFQSSFSWVFYLPLAIIGFDPVVFIVVNQFQTLYQFWIHTQLIGTMHPAIEFVLNTPSHHRVHHGINPKYIDRNHGGTLIIWDRMFGTFQKEEEEVVYGVTKPLQSWNPVWANFDYFADIFRLIIHCRTLGDMLRVLVKGPGWRPDYLGGAQVAKEVKPREYRKFDTVVTSALSAYVLAQYVILILGTSAFLVFSGILSQQYAGWPSVLIFAGIGSLIFFSIASIGAMLAMQSWGKWAEMPRLVMTFTLAACFTANTNAFVPFIVGGICWVLLSALWLRKAMGSSRYPQLSGLISEKRQ